MPRKLTVTIDEKVHEGLRRLVGRGRVTRFIEGLIRTHVVDADLETAYREMSLDEAREAEAREWSDNLIGDLQNDPR